VRRVSSFFCLLFLNTAAQTNIPPTAYRDIQRWTDATGICQRICKAHVFDETFGVNSAFNAEVLVAAPHAVAMEFGSVRGEAESSLVKGGGISKGSGWIASSRIAQSQAGPRFKVLTRSYRVYRMANISYPRLHRCYFSSSPRDSYFSMKSRKMVVITESTIPNKVPKRKS